jgi:hypothetical protein
VTAKLTIDKFLAKARAKQARFNLAMALELPQIQMTDVSVKPVKGEYEIKVKWTNTGKLPVALEQANLVKMVQQDRVSLVIDKGLTKAIKKPMFKSHHPM